ncbi:hypothetical protein [Nocardia miyunensis]|uniref:hypothetical protein n=1 Tax=Nocardia miyunensis TaxID=282684 RepID=UPI00082C5556|nr:hypothetical protein [Nocardia miyunensis]
MSTKDDASQSIPSTAGADDRTSLAPLTTDEKTELMMLVKTPDLPCAQIARMIELSQRHAASRPR